MEVDGVSHEGNEAYDKKRDSDLRLWGIATTRYANEEVLMNLDGIIVDIEMRIAQRAKERGQ